eukprot:Seg2249.2 transcript_id=Seg2249.2/GoldUCD/mRNA.D3Y31 product=Fibropellin-1 protein_id=Seg2249.2/GoldUCD/D3Y31
MNKCRSNPCQNGAICTNTGADSFRCTCVPGYIGDRCQTEINMCMPDPCKNGASCANRRTDYYCACPAGFTGKNCQTNINECAPNPCFNGGSCADLINDYNCTCVPGFTGKDCNVNINECHSSPCLNGGQCIDEVNGYRCQCRPGFTGVNCQTNIDDCAPNPCKNGGEYEINKHKATFHFRTIEVQKIRDAFATCTCLPGYTGKSCEIDINECLPDICNNGSCTDKVNGYECSCFAGYNGTNCEININDCSSNPCQNGGKCVDGVNSYKCQCLPGYTDKHCGTNINECDSRPCLNGAKCIDGIANYTCNCSAGYEGRNCQQRINHCASKPCNNSGTCINELTEFRCVCATGYTGKTCDINMDDCLPNPCNMTGSLRCIDQVAAYKCDCIKGYTGKFCEIDVDDCDPGNTDIAIEGVGVVTEFGFCGRNGKCIDGINMYNCSCDKGWTGKKCEIDIDECQTHPCKNGGSCFQTYNADYVCECQQGFKGKNCSINIDDCAKNPCCEGSTCIDGINDFTCSCAAGMKGIDCCSTFEEMISTPWRRRKNILILGDLNSDMLRRNASSELGQQGKKLQRVLKRAGVKNVIKEPTRIAEATETLIDLIITSTVSKVVKAGSIELSISDHKLVYCVTNLQQTRKKPLIKYSRNYKNMDINGFREALETTPWWVSSVFEETDDVLNAWELLYNNVVDEYIKVRKAKVRKDSLPWITTDIRKIMNRRYRLLNKWQRDKDPQTHHQYKEARNLARKELRKAESKYWRQEFEKAGNSKEFWQTVKRVERKKVIKRLGPEDENCQIHTEDASKAEVLNTFCSNVGQELAEKLPESQKEKPEKATGPDNIRAKDLSIAGEFIINGIRGLFNKILHQREFPQNWKCGKLKVAYKSGMPTNRGNYRPLSMLSILSKMLEGHQLTNMQRGINCIVQSNGDILKGNQQKFYCYF